MSAYLDLDQPVDRETFVETNNELVKEKKKIQAQIAVYECNQNPWFEPFKRWVSMAQQVRKIAETGSPHEKKSLALQMFGSNLVLNGKTAHGRAVKPWSFLRNEASNLRIVHVYSLARTFFLECM